MTRRTAARSTRRPQSTEPRVPPEPTTVRSRFGAALVVGAGAAILLLASAEGSAQPVPLDPVELQINELTSGDQDTSDVAVLANGSFVVVWSSDISSGTDTNLTSIQSRRFSADGTPLDPAEVQVNTYTTSYQRNPAVSALGSDGFVIVWASSGSAGTDTSGWSIQARRFDADGSPIDSAEFQVNHFTIDLQNLPDVARRDDGGFVVTWTSQEGAAFYEVRARRFAADGAPLDLGDLAVNSLTEAGQLFSTVDADAAGNFVVVWAGGYVPSYPITTEVRGRRFWADGTPRDVADFVISPDEFTYDGGPDIVASDDGAFVVVWSGDTSGSFQDILARRFDANGAPLDPEPLRIDTEPTAALQWFPHLAVDGDGNFVVVWFTTGGPGSENDLRGRRFRADGTALDPADFRLNSWTTGSQTNPHLELNASGDFLVSWSSSTSPADSSGNSVHIRRFRGLPFFADDFETGDASRWSSSHG